MGSKGYTIEVRTGDKKGAGTNANVYVILINTNGQQSHDIHLDRICRDDFEAGNTDKFQVRDLANFGDIADLELWRTGRTNDTWYVDWIKVHNNDNSKVFVFPIHRWMLSGRRIKLQEDDCVLPQFAKFHEQRMIELEEKKKMYAFAPAHEGLPCQVVDFPEDEDFSFSYKFKLGVTSGVDKVDGIIDNIITACWDSLSDIGDIYGKMFRVPTGLTHWRSDVEFGRLRLTGCNPGIIRLCTEIPENFAVTTEMLQPLLDGLTIEGAIKKKLLFIVDLKVLENINCTHKYKKICSPIALFFVSKQSTLMPVAIQLFQEKADHNPVFLPTDDEYTWILAKMWYNNADASYHQSVAHLGMTHLVVESIAAATHCCLSPSHPLFRLLAPHFLYLFAINKFALEDLVAEGAWVDQAMSIGRKGLFEIIRRRFRTWRLDIDGTFPKDLESRGLLDPKVLPNYHFRDDGMLLWDAISKYVATVVNAHYDTPEKISEDYELQKWHNTLSSPVSAGGCGINGVPGDGSFKYVEEIVNTITSTIFTSSVSHAAVNFGQYDNYAYPPNYPSILSLEPPMNKDPKTADHVFKSLPDKKITLSIMKITHLLSMKGTNGLGNFEVKYQFDPVGMEAVKQFQADLETVGETIDQRNEHRESEYDYLHPKNVPNAISI